MSRSIVLATEVEASPEQAYDAVSSTTGLAAFWTPTVDGAYQVGGTLRLGFEAAPVDLEMTVAVLDPPRRVQWECAGPWPHWGGTLVEWTIHPGETTTVALSHQGWSEEQSDIGLGSVAMTWALVLLALKSYLATGKPAPALA